MKMTPSFWNKLDDVSVARKLRLAAVKNVFDQGMIDVASARKILSDQLTPGDETTYFDDSSWLLVAAQVLD